MSLIWNALLLLVTVTNFYFLSISILISFLKIEWNDEGYLKPYHMLEWLVFRSVACRIRYSAVKTIYYYIYY